MFDNLLKDSVNSKSTTKTTTNKVKAVNNKVQPNIEKTKINTPTANVINESKNTQTPSSLLDKMVLDITKELPTNGKIIKTQEDKNSPKKQVNDSNVKSDTKTSSSLLDKIVLDITEELPINGKIIKTQEEKSTSKEQVNEKISATKNTVNTNISSKDINSNIQDKIVQTKIVSNVKVETVKPSILLDKIVADVKSQIKEKIVVKEVVSIKESKTVKTIPSPHKNTKVSDVSTKITDDEIGIKENILLADDVTKVENNKQISSNINEIKPNIQNEQIVVTNDVQTINHNISLNKNKTLDSQNDKIISSTKDIDTIVKTTEIQDTTSIKASMFLSAQKDKNGITQAQIISESKNIIENQKDTKGIKQSANKLKLNPSNISVQKNSNVEVKVVKNNENIVASQMKSSNDILAKITLINNSNIIQEDKDVAIKSLEIQHTKIQQNDKVIHKEKVIQKDIIEVTVSNSVEQTITNKIIGARQQLGNTMSEVARNMYLNYKPPLTAFRMNLNPANLGNIAIVMKSDKSTNSMNISLNMSSSATLDAFTDNKLALQNSLQQHFTNNASSVSLNFAMQDDTSSQSFGQFQQEQRKNNENENTTVENTSVATSEELEEKNTDYM